jgi:hypothetical protein
MDEQQQHEMILDGTNESGEEIWYCPTCGRRMIITWHPWKKAVIFPGDVYAAHSVSKGGLRLSPIQITHVQDYSSSSDFATEDPYLAPWQRWLDSVDSGDLGIDNL